jgi:hypothetical protein
MTIVKFALRKIYLGYLGGGRAAVQAVLAAAQVVPVAAGWSCGGHVVRARPR